MHLTPDPDHGEEEEEDAEGGPGRRLVAPVLLAAGHARVLAPLLRPAPPVHVLCLQRLHLEWVLSKL